MRHLSSNRYAAEVMQQHVSPIEPPQSTHENAVQPEPEQSAPLVPATQSAEATPPAEDDPAEQPYLDHAYGILAADPTIDQETRAMGWDAYYSASTPEQLVRNLSSLEIPDTTRQKLLAAKQVTAPTQSNAEKVANALHQMSQIDPALLDLAEKHKHVAKMMIDAAVKNEPFKE